MKAIVQDRYGGPEVLRLEEIERPPLEPDRVLVRVRSAAVNPADWHVMRADPRWARLMFGLRRPKRRVRGADFSGVVEEVGSEMAQFHVGDAVFGGRDGALAEYVAAKSVVAKPDALTFEQAGGIAIAGCTALQAVRNKGRLQPGQRVLVNGAAGGVGTFAVQIAKALGGHVTGVCSTRNRELVRSVGADDVVDYTTTDFTKGEARYDLVVDCIGNRAANDVRRVLTKNGTLVTVGGDGGILGLVTPLLLNVVVPQRLVSFIARIGPEDLQTLADLAKAGQLTPFVDRTYPLEEAPEAIRYLETKRARGKVVVNVS
jgi:NADPH:quinone reductase-like Zn-dependent oxidoreductase